MMAKSHFALILATLISACAPIPHSENPASLGGKEGKAPADSAQNDYETQLNLALKGDAAAQYRIGVHNWPKFDGDKKNEADAVSWFRKSAAQGYADAEYMLGQAYERGLGVEQNDISAVEWYRRAADKNVASAQYRLGRMYGGGRGGLDKDYLQMVSLTMKAAEQNYVYAEHALGIFYENGMGVERDEQKALIWLQRAVEHGDTYCAYLMALIYDTGELVPKDETKAAKWYGVASEGGVPDADMHLGHMYKEGIGVNKDLAIAYKLWSRSINKVRTDSPAYKLVSEEMGDLKKNLGPEEVSRIDSENASRH